MTSSEWRQFLQLYSDELLKSVEPRIQIPEEARAARWMGFDPATLTAIEQTEERLGRNLPPSLRTFYQTTNGWRATGVFISDVLPVEQLMWLKDKNDHLYEIACKNAARTRPFSRDVDGSSLRDYVLNQGVRVKRSLVISSWGDAAIWLLDPGEDQHNGEWSAGRWASWSPGMEWNSADFEELMKEELKSHVRLRDV